MKLRLGPENTLQAQMPSGHYVTLPFAISSLQLIKEILVAQRKAERAEAAARKIGNDGNLTQHQADMWLAAHRKAEREARAAETANKFGVNLDSLEIKL